MDLLFVRILFVGLVATVSYFLQPFALPALPAAALGAIAAALIIGAELRLRSLPLTRLLGAAIGGILGLLATALCAFVLRSAVPTHAAAFQIAVLLLLTYLGLLLGASQGDALTDSLLHHSNLTDPSPANPNPVNSNPVSPNPASPTAPTRPEPAPQPIRILDTSVIIDGRIADVAETGFLHGPLVVPEFVLHELQSVADSADPSRRQRGRRGLDILQRMQSIPGLQLHITAEDFPAIREVDLKLLELARKSSATVVTNDFNLNKVAQLHRVPVLNVNDLANALRPVFLPGEKMQIMILKEGKEFNQGVGYLDDGTMVVVDHARRAIGRSVEITVTSVLQTASGKMIFGRLEGSSTQAESSTHADQAAHAVELTH